MQQRVGQQLDHPFAVRKLAITIARRHCDRHVQLPSLSHRGYISPVPIPRSAAATPGGGLRDWSARAYADLRRVSAEHRLAAPRAMNSSIEPFSISSAERRSAYGVRLFVTILDTGGGRDQHKPLDPLRRLQRDVQSDTTTHRIAPSTKRLGLPRARSPRTSRR